MIEISVITETTAQHGSDNGNKRSNQGINRKASAPKYGGKQTTRGVQGNEWTDGRRCKPTARWPLTPSCHCGCLWDTCHAPESPLGFPSIPKMSGSVFRTSERSTNGSSDGSVDEEEIKEKKEKEAKLSQIKNDDVKWTWQSAKEPFCWMTCGT